MVNHIRSSWNSDRVAGSILNTPKKARKPRAASTLKEMRASDRLVQLYGKEAYEAWKRREAEINALRDSGKYAASCLARMYADNYRRMTADRPARPEVLAKPANVSAGRRAA